MKILLTNDDGVGSPGLWAVKEALDRLGGENEIWIIAPDGERSGMSHYITLKDPIRTKQIDSRVYSISGSPADCVITAVLGIMDEKPDLVISGINIGPNLGTDITYSGTAAAARQAAYMNIPGVALSLVDMKPPYYFSNIANFIAKNLDKFVELWDEHHFLNVNSPNSEQEIDRIEITHPCRRRYNDRLVNYKAPRGDIYWFLDGAPIDTSDEKGTDWNAVKSGAISVSPIHIHPLNNLIEEEYRRAGLLVPG